MIKPDPQWMQDYPLPERGGETLGHYKDWSFMLAEDLEQCSADQAAERAFYSTD